MSASASMCHCLPFREAVSWWALWLRKADENAPS